MASDELRKRRDHLVSMVRGLLAADVPFETIRAAALSLSRAGSSLSESAELIAGQLYAATPELYTDACFATKKREKMRLRAQDKVVQANAQRNREPNAQELAKRARRAAQSGRWDDVISLTTLDPMRGAADNEMLCLRILAQQKLRVDHLEAEEDEREERTRIPETLVALLDRECAEFGDCRSGLRLSATLSRVALPSDWSLSSSERKDCSKRLVEALCGQMLQSQTERGRVWFSDGSSLPYVPPLSEELPVTLELSMARLLAAFIEDSRFSVMEIATSHAAILSEVEGTRLLSDEAALEHGTTASVVVADIRSLLLEKLYPELADKQELFGGIAHFVMSRGMPIEFIEDPLPFATLDELSELLESDHGDTEDFDASFWNASGGGSWRSIKNYRAYQIPERGHAEVVFPTAGSEMTDLRSVRFLQEGAEPPAVFVVLSFDMGEEEVLVPGLVTATGGLRLPLEEPCPPMWTALVLGAYRDLVIKDLEDELLVPARPLNSTSERSSGSRGRSHRNLPRGKKGSRREPIEIGVWHREIDYLLSLVVGHMRWISSEFLASLERQRLAREHGVSLPRGYTWVTAHERHQDFRGDVVCGGPTKLRRRTLFSPSARTKQLCSILL